LWWIAKRTETDRNGQFSAKLVYKLVSPRPVDFLGGAVTPEMRRAFAKATMDAAYFAEKGVLEG
jgi:hypothetical protein